MATRTLIVGEENSQESERRSRKISHTSEVSSVGSWVIMPMNAKVGKVQVGVINMLPLQ